MKKKKKQLFRVHSINNQCKDRAYDFKTQKHVQWHFKHKTTPKKNYKVFLFILKNKIKKKKIERVRICCFGFNYKEKHIKTHRNLLIFTILYIDDIKVYIYIYIFIYCSSWSESTYSFSTDAVGDANIVNPASNSLSDAFWASSMVLILGICNTFSSKLGLEALHNVNGGGLGVNPISNPMPSNKSGDGISLISGGSAITIIPSFEFLEWLQLLDLAEYDRMIDGFPPFLDDICTDDDWLIFGIFCCWNAGGADCWCWNAGGECIECEDE